MPGDQQKSKADQINAVQQNLPLPEDPPTEPDWQSADARNVNVGSGRFAGDVSTGDGITAGLREPASKSSEETDMSGIGRQGVEGVKHLRKDIAVKKLRATGL